MKGILAWIKEIMKEWTPSLTLRPAIDYQRCVPKSAEQLMREDWNRTGDSLRKAMKTKLK